MMIWWWNFFLLFFYFYFEKLQSYEMVGWHHRLNGHEFEQTLRDGEGQGSLVCGSPWGCKESNTTEQQQNPFLIFKEFSFCKWRQSSPTIEAKSQVFAFIVSTASMRWACESDSTNQSLGYKEAETASKPHVEGRWEWCWDSAHGQISVVKVGTQCPHQTTP